MSRGGSRNGGGSEAPVVGLSRGIHNMSVAASDSYEAFIRLGGIELLDFMGHAALARPAHSGNQGIGDLAGAPRLRVQNVGLEILAQQNDGQGAEQDKHQR